MEQVFSIQRMWAMVVKEFVQMRRDRLTFAMMLGIPLMQLILFGFAINSDPRHLPTALLCADNSIFSRSIVTGMENSTYFRIDHVVASQDEAADLIDTGQVVFALTIPDNFASDLVAGRRPVLFLEVDATDPAATSSAVSAFNTVVKKSLDRDLTGHLAGLKQKPLPVDIRVHARYNPEGRTQYNIVPGLMGVVLTMTLVIITGLAITRENERGTMENLLSTPVKPIEVMTGKIAPYILVGYFQMLLILAAAKFVFHVPMHGSPVLLLALSFLFICANLAVGVTISTVARNQLQAMQMAMFFFLPSILLTGFMFPFEGMPGWARALGSILPLTHYLRLVRGIVLKGNGLAEIAHTIWPMGLFLAGVLALGVKRFKQTLD